MHCFTYIFYVYSCIRYFLLFFFFKQKTAYDMRISDWSSDVCSSDLADAVEIVLPKGKHVQMRLEFCRLTELGAEAGTIKDAGDDPDVTHEIGRASCRARVWQYV